MESQKKMTTILILVVFDIIVKYKNDQIEINIYAVTVKLYQFNKMSTFTSVKVLKGTKWGLGYMYIIITYNALLRSNVSPNTYWLFNYFVHGHWKRALSGYGTVKLPFKLRSS